MGTFKSSKLIEGSPELIPQVGEDIVHYFTCEGYDVKRDSLLSGGFDISVSKGNLFKAVLGMKTALKIIVQPQNGNIHVEACVGIFGQQAVPSVISVLLFWPVMVTQIWGMVQQSKLDDKVIEIAENSVRGHGGDTARRYSNDKKFCTQCGGENTAAAKFCSECGGKF
jgi:hypothetical protein